jgi:hypothetical protein
LKNEPSPNGAKHILTDKQSRFVEEYLLVKLRSEAVGLTVDRIWAEWRRIALSDVGDILGFMRGL